MAWIKLHRLSSIGNIPIHIKTEKIKYITQNLGKGYNKCTMLYFSAVNGDHINVKESLDDVMEIIRKAEKEEERWP